MEYDVLAVTDYPFPKHYIDSITNILKDNDPFLIFSIDDESKKYSIFSFSYSEEMLGNTFIAYIDRNILTYAYQFMHHEKRTIKQQQLALSCLIYLNFFQTKYELSQSLIELINSSTINDHLKDEVYNWNYLLDLLHSVDIYYLLDFIETGINNLPEIDFNRFKSKDLSGYKLDPDDSWHSIYIHILKLANIQKKGLKSIKGIKYYFDWIINDFKSDVVCVYFSIILFSSKQNYETIYERPQAIKNITWDISHITNWFHESLEHIQKTKEIDILVTNDRKLKEIATFLSNTSKRKSIADQFFNKVLHKYYTNEETDIVLELLNSFQSALSSSHRHKRGFNDLEEKKKMIAELEITLR